MFVLKFVTEWLNKKKLEGELQVEGWGGDVELGVSSPLHCRSNWGEAVHLHSANLTGLCNQPVAPVAPCWLRLTASCCACRWNFQPRWSFSQKLQDGLGSVNQGCQAEFRYSCWHIVAGVDDVQISDFNKLQTFRKARWEWEAAVQASWG